MKRKLVVLAIIWITIWSQPWPLLKPPAALGHKSSGAIDQAHKSQNAPVPHPTMRHSEQKCAHFCSECCIVGYGTSAFWDLWIATSVLTRMTRKRIPHYWTFMRRIKSHPHKGSVMRSFMFFCVFFPELLIKESSCRWRYNMVSLTISYSHSSCLWLLTISMTTDNQGSFCVCAQPMRDDVTLQRRLSLAGRIHKMIPAIHFRLRVITIMFYICSRMQQLVSDRRNKVLNQLQWRHNGRDGVLNHQPHHCLLNRVFRRNSKKSPKLRVTGFCAGNSPVTGEFPAQMASNADNVSIWWRHHVWLISDREPWQLCLWLPWDTWRPWRWFANDWQELWLPCTWRYQSDIEQALC